MGHSNVSGMVGAYEMKKIKILYLITEDWYFWSHRLPIAQEAQRRGYEVLVATRVGLYEKRLTNLGFRVIPLKTQRGSINLWKELVALKQIISVYLKEKPDIVHHVAMKPVLQGTIAASIAKTPYVVNAITGMGYIFTSDDLKARFIKPLVNLGLKFLLNRKKLLLILQNKDDMSFFIAKGIDSNRMRLIKGSGVDTMCFQPCLDNKKETPVVVLIGRMLWDKGVREFVEAAMILKNEGIKGRFILIGDTDPHNSAMISPAQLKKWSREGFVEWLGHRHDIAELLSQSSIACLPSYREGLPKFLLEAASCGLPIVAADVPGCRDIVRDGENGLLVPVKDAAKLANALKQLIENPELCHKMGIRGREIVIKYFAVENVVSQTMKLYKELLQQ
jgi:glycosyltransferase involved in cell wall biosynthesis